MRTHTTDHSRRYRARRSRTTPPWLLISVLASAIIIGHVGACAQSLVVDFTIGSFTSAVSLSVASTGEIFVLDAGSNACVRFSHDGTELSRVQGTGWGASEFDSPTDVSGSFPLAVFVSDGKNKRVLQFDKDLHSVQSIDDVQTTDGKEFEGLFIPIATAQSLQGELFVLDADGTRIVKFSTRFRAEHEFGTYASGEGRLNAPTDLCMTEDGRLAVVDGTSIVYFDQFGNYLSRQTVDADEPIRTIASSNGDILAVSPTEISVVSSSQEATTAGSHVKAEMIVGESGVTFRDAARTDKYWLILTPKTLLVCSRNNK